MEETDNITTSDDVVRDPHTTKTTQAAATITTNMTTNNNTRRKKATTGGKKGATKKAENKNKKKQHQEQQSPESLFQQSVEWAKARHRLLRSVEGSEQEHGSSVPVSGAFDDSKENAANDDARKSDNVDDTPTNDDDENHNTDSKDDNNVSALTANVSKTDTTGTGGGEGGIVPFVSLIFGSNSNKNRGPSSLPNKEPLQILQNRKAFQKNHLRRFFAAMADTLVHIVENELFIPESNFELDEDEAETENEHAKGRTNNSLLKKSDSHIGGTADANDTSHQPSTIVVEPDEESTNALLYMRACAFAVEAYLEGELERRGKQSTSEGNNNNKNDSHVLVKQQEHPVMEEVSMVASMLHDTIFSLEGTICGKLGDTCQKDVCKMCESWWFGMFQNRDPMVTQLVPLLFQKSLDYTTTYTTNANITLDHQAPNAHHHEPKLADVKRVWAMRGALSLFDFEEENIAYLKSLMLRSVSSPLYLKTNDGKRIIAELFQLHPSMTDDLHKAIKAQIPNAKKAVLQAYGDIYFRAWKLSLEHAPFEDDDEDKKDDSDDEDDSKASDDENKSEEDDDDDLSRTHPRTLRQCLEEHALQDFMVGVLHAAEPMTAKALRTVLNVFHTSKRSPDVERLLYRLYGPILWRALKASHPSIKVNAAAILADTFPLRDPTPTLMARLKQASGAPTEDVLDKTVTALLALLHDDYPKVRVAGSDATARILAAFWDAIPPDHIRTLLNVIVLQHACDSSSAAVRVSSISAIMILLEEAPHTYHVLRALLPHMGNLIHDKVERVRLATVKMLLCVSNHVEHIKFYHVVPVDHLLAQLAMEGRSYIDNGGFASPSSRNVSPVASALTELLLNSYFPQGENVTGSMQVQRSLGLMSSHPTAATVFYQHLSQHLSVNSIAKLIHMLHRCLIAAIQTDEKENGGKMDIDDEEQKDEGNETKNDENSEEDGEEETMKNDSTISNAEGTQEKKKGQTLLIASNTPLMASMTETISILWSSINDDLNDVSKEASRIFLHKSFEGDALLKEYTYFQRLAAKYGKRYHHVETTTNSKKAVSHLLSRITDCRRVCGALLTCGTLMPRTLIPNFVDAVTKDLWSSKRSEHSVSHGPLSPWEQRKGSSQYHKKSMGTAVPQALSLLCRWNRTEDIVNEACASIRSFFGLKGRDGEDERMQQDNTLHIMMMVDDEEKQNNTTTTKGSSKTTLAQVEMAISVLQHILRCDAATSSFSSALRLSHREILLQSKTILKNVEDSLKGAFLKLEDVFRDPSSGRILGEEWKLEDVKMMILAFECYCRLLLHKLSLPSTVDQEDKENIKEDTMDTDNENGNLRENTNDEEENPDGKEGRGLVHLVKWITQTILPAIQRPSAFSDMLDISKIAPLTDLSMIASSTSATKHPRPGSSASAASIDRNSIGVVNDNNESASAMALRLSNISSTFRPSAAGMGVSFMNDAASPLEVYIQALATVVMHVTCIFTAEWLALGGGNSDTWAAAVSNPTEGTISYIEAISTEITQWLVVFKQQGNPSTYVDETMEQEVTKGHKDLAMTNSILLPSMGRLIIQLSRTSSPGTNNMDETTNNKAGIIAFKSLLDITKPLKPSSSEAETIESIVHSILTTKPLPTAATVTQTKNGDDVSSPLSPREEAIKIVYEMVKTDYNATNNNQTVDGHSVESDEKPAHGQKAEDDEGDVDDVIGMPSTCSTAVALSSVFQHSASCSFLAKLIVRDILAEDVESDDANANYHEQDAAAETTVTSRADLALLEHKRMFAVHMARKLLYCGKLPTSGKKNVQDALRDMEKKMNNEPSTTTTTSNTDLQESSPPSENTTETPMDTEQMEGEE